MPTMASAPTFWACATMRRKASSRACSQTFSYSEMLPPKMDFSPPVTPATMLVARTTSPRTTPLYSAIWRPAMSFDVVTMTGMALFVAGPECPCAQAAGDHRRHPGRQYGNLETGDVHRPLVQRPHGLQHGYDAEDNTGNDDILVGHSILLLKSRPPLV